MTLTQINKAGLDEIALDHVFTIGASGSSAYTFQGEGLNGTVNNPTLYLTRGKTYRFENGSGGHPIRIQSTSGASGTAYNTGVTNNAGSGTVIVEVQHDAPDVLYYQCTSHAAMNGILYITGALADGGVTTAKIAADAVTGAKIADDSIDSEHYADGSIDTAHIADAQITDAKIASGISSSKLTGALPAIDGSALTGLAAFPSGTKMLFAQSAAPTGWTKNTTNNDRALRVVNGSSGGSQGGSNSFTTALNSSFATSGGAVANHTLTIAEIPSHNHGITAGSGGGVASVRGWSNNDLPRSTQSTGGGGAHNHGFTNPSFNLNVAYVDVIIANKD